MPCNITQKQFVGRATKLTAPNGLPGQITLVRSPNGFNRTALQLTELQQHQSKLPAQQQQRQQQSTKGQRSHRVRKTKVPAVAKVIADPDVAREVQNAVDASHDEDTEVSHSAQADAGMGCPQRPHALATQLHRAACIAFICSCTCSKDLRILGLVYNGGELCMLAAGQTGRANLEECTAVEAGQHSGAEQTGKTKGLNHFLAAKLADAIGKSMTCYSSVILSCCSAWHIVCLPAFMDTQLPTTQAVAYAVGSNASVRMLA